MQTEQKNKKGSASLTLGYMRGCAHEDVYYDGEERGVDAHDGVSVGQERVRHAYVMGRVKKVNKRRLQSRKD